MVILKDDTKERTSKGRRKIEIKKIEKLSSRQVTFSKRKLGLFKKASELCILTGAQIAIIIHSHNNHVFSFGHPTANAVIERFRRGEGAEDCAAPTQPEFARDYNLHHADVCKELEVEKKRGEEYAAAAGGNGLWWCDGVEGKTVEELEEYASALEVLRNKITTRADEILLVQNYSNSLAAGVRNPHLEAALPMSTGGVGCSLDGTMFVNQGFEFGHGF